MSRWHNCPNLAAFWCNTITLIFYFYVIYTAGIRYNYWKISINNPRYGLEWNDEYLMFYLICILTSCILWILMLYSTIFKTGNYANDYINIRKSIFLMSKNVQYRGALDVLLRIIDRIKYHLSPFSCIVHVIGAYCLILPLNLFVSEQISHDIINQESGVWLAPYVPEIINLLLALVSLTIRAPSLFVSSCAQLGISISLYLFVASFSLFFNILSRILYPSTSAPATSWCYYHPFILLIFLLNTVVLHEAGRVRLISRLMIGQAPKLPYMTRHSPSIIAFLLWIVNLAFHICMYASRSSLAPWWVPRGIWLAPFTIDFSLVILHQLVWLVVWLLLLFKTDWVFIFDQVNLLLETEESHKSPNPSFIICPIRGDPNQRMTNQQQLFCSNKDGADSFISDSLNGRGNINIVGSRSTPYGMDSTTVYTCFHANNNLINDPDNHGNSPNSNDAGHLLPIIGGSLMADGSMLSSGGNSVGNHSSSNTSGASIPPPPASSTSKSSSNSSSNNSHPHYQTHSIRYTPTNLSKTRNRSPSELIMGVNNPDEIMLEESNCASNYGNYGNYGTHSGNYGNTGAGNYEDINTISGRHSVNPSRATPRSLLNDICEEKITGATNTNTMGSHDYFRSPNTSQRSSTMPSGSDSGIGGVVTTGTLLSRNMLLGENVTKPHHTGLLLDEQQNNLCSDV